MKKEKICLITGASSGLGKATALALAKKGFHLILVCRNKEKSKKVIDYLIKKSGNKNIDLLIADLSLQSDIRTLAEKLKSNYQKIDVLINNAGVLSTSRKETKEGFELTFAVNQLAYFLLTNLLLDLLLKSDDARIINLSSAMHKTAIINLIDPQGKINYNGAKAYSHSKLANIMFTYELAKRLEGKNITVNCLHPGFVATNIARDNLLLKFVMFFSKLFAASPKKGAETSIYLASSDEVKNITGKYFIDKKETKSSDITYNEVACEQLWEMCEEMAPLK